MQRGFFLYLSPSATASPTAKKNHLQSTPVAKGTENIPNM